jgi:hypothetical protein
MKKKTTKSNNLAVPSITEDIEGLAAFEQMLCEAAKNADLTSPAQGTGADFTALLTSADGRSVLVRTARFLDSEHQDECLWQLRLESIRLRAKLGGIVMRMTMPCGGPVNTREGLIVCCESQNQITARLIPIHLDDNGSFAGLGKSVTMPEGSLWWNQLISTIGWLVPPEELLGRNLAAIIALDHKENIPLVRALLAGYEVERSVVSCEGRAL